VHNCPGIVVGAVPAVSMSQRVALIDLFDREQVQPVLGSPSGELAQVRGVGPTSQAAGSGQEPSQRLSLAHLE